MELFIIPLILLVALDLAALCWGFDSRDRIDSHEWERRGSSKALALRLQKPKPEAVLMTDEKRLRENSSQTPVQSAAS
jgi:hypothetical protein